MYKFKAKVWVYPGEAAWYFINLSKELTEQIDFEFGDLKAGFGSLPVEVRVGQTKWQTSIFPDTKKSCYMLPLKASVRKAENISADSIVAVELSIRK